MPCIISATRFAREKKNMWNVNRHFVLVFLGSFTPNMHLCAPGSHHDLYGTLIVNYVLLGLICPWASRMLHFVLIIVEFSWIFVVYAFFLSNTLLFWRSCARCRCVCFVSCKYISFLFFFFFYTNWCKLVYTCKFLCSFLVSPSPTIMPIWALWALNK